MEELGKLVCEVCGEDLTGKGLLYNGEHYGKCHSIEYKPYSDGEMRNAFLELGMPKMAYDAMGYVAPTEMERIIFEEPIEVKKPVYFMSKVMYDAMIKLENSKR